MFGDGNEFVLHLPGLFRQRDPVTPTVGFVIVTPDQTVPLHDIKDAGEISLVLCDSLGDFGLSGAFPCPKTIPQALKPNVHPKPFPVFLSFDLYIFIAAEIPLQMGISAQMLAHSQEIPNRSRGQVSRG